MNFDLVMVATLRPELLKTTLNSFKENLFQNRLKQTKLIINLDMVGSEENHVYENYMEIQSILYNLKFKEILLRVSNKPHFGIAWFWAMVQARSELIFYLEEDWQLLKQVNFDKMLKLFREDEKLVHLRLSQFASRDTTCKNWNKFLVWNGKYFEPKIEEKGLLGFCGHPSLNRRSFLRNCMLYMDPYANPEKQIKTHRIPTEIDDLINESNFGSFIKPNEPAQIIDLGRIWMQKHGWIKQGNKAFFTTWERSE